MLKVHIGISLTLTFVNVNKLNSGEDNTLIYRMFFFIMPLFYSISNIVDIGPVNTS